MQSRHWLRTSGAVLALAVVGATAAALPAQAAPGKIRNAGVQGTIPGSYIVVLSDGASTKAVAPLAAKYGGKVTHTYRHALHGFATTMSEADAKKLAADPQVSYVEQDAMAHATGTQPNPGSWGLDRTDQEDLPLDNSYTYANDGSGATVYVVDTGTYFAHPDFGGRATSGYDFIDDDSDASDCAGHGTHVTGTVGSTTYGMAKKTHLVAVRVLDCEGNGPWTDVIAGIDWVADHAQGPSVMTMSLGGGSNSSVNSAVQGVIDQGITATVAAGNEGQNACNVSPASVPDAITVAASDKQDRRSIWNSTQSSNYGSCVDIFAPGSDIISTRNGGGTQSMGGTSMATPHVAGAAALYLTAHPSATPAQVAQAFVDNASLNKISDVKGSPNKLLNVSFLNDGDTPPPGDCGVQTNNDDVSIPDAGAAVTSDIVVTGCDGKAPADLPVEVDINHTYTGDLQVDLVGPSGAVYPLKRSGGIGANGLHETYTVDASSENANGTWKLRVKDVYRFDTGTVDSWSITL